MSSAKISALSPASAFDGTEVSVLVQAGGDVSATLERLAAYSNGALFCYLNADYTLTSTTAAQKLFNTTTNGALTLPASGLYRVEGQIYLTTMSGTSGNGAVSIIGAGTATVAGQLLHALGVDNTTPTNAVAQTGNFAQGSSAFGTNTVLAATGTAMGATIFGMFKCTATGTLIPSIALVTSAAAVVKAGSWIRFTRIADASVYSQGGWS